MNWRPASAELATVDSTFLTWTKFFLILGPSSSRPPLMFYPPMVTSNIYRYPDDDNEYWCYWLWVMVRLQMLQERNVCRRKRREIRDMEQSHPKWDHSAGWSKNIWSMSSISSEFPSWIVILIFIVIFQSQTAATTSRITEEFVEEMVGGNPLCGFYHQPHHRHHHQGDIELKWPASPRWQLNDCLKTTVQTNWFQAFSCLPWWSQYFG